nr:MAG TPA: hypothetical protein [Caudoviricetes sp.]
MPKSCSFPSRCYVKVKILQLYILNIESDRESLYF